jgi:hypothetical protein
MPVLAVMPVAALAVASLSRARPASDGGKPREQRDVSHTVIK